MKKNLINTTLFAVALFFVLQTSAQPHFKTTLPQVYQNNLPLKNPWSGGFNSALFSTIDLNFDGIKDLFVFDKQFNSIYPGVYKMRTFINKGTAQTVDYLYAPQYEQFFPQDMTGWCTLIDFNCDGLEDIFCYNIATGGIKVYRNTSSGTTLSFLQEFNSLTSCYIAPFPLPCSIQNLTALPVNVPAFTDVNNDGDLDILTFKVTGQTVEYHENMGKEMFNKCDTLVYLQLEDTFAHFQLNSFSNSATLGLLRLAAPGNASKANDGLHSGSCMIAYDEGGDGDKDLINGDLLGNNLLYLNNAATLAGVNDSMDYQDTIFPFYNSSVNYVTFPSPFLFDADNDGNKDLIVSSCTENQSENYNNNLFYKNTGNNTNYYFQFIKNRFLTEEMIDVGSASYPVFFDIDNDGKKDLFIGNKGYMITNTGNVHLEGAISYYRNITQVNGCPAFELITPDFANIQQYALTDVVPTFGDIDGDGDADLLVGNSDGIFYLFTNSGGTFSLAAGGVNYQGIDVGTNSAPQLVDMDGDLLLDLIVGETFGRIYYYHNTGTATNPVFTFVTGNLGGINVTNTTWTIYGNSIPCLFIENGQQKLLVGSESGYCFLFDNITGNLAGNFNLVTATAYNIFEPYRSAPALADLNNDASPEIIVGCFAGGLGFYTNNLAGCTSGIIPAMGSDFSFQVYPNPASQNLIVDFEVNDNSEKKIEIINVLGKKVFERYTIKQKEFFDLAKTGNGIYVIKISSGNITSSQKIIIK